MKIRNKDDLIDYVNHSNRVKYIFFWGHKKSQSGVSKTCLSQWYESSFEVNSVLYKTAEHYMMSEKALLFGDIATSRKIINAKNSGEAKRLGRTVKSFDEKVWLEHRFNIVVKGNVAKFEQNSELKNFLGSTGSHILVEASPVDKVWGIGLDANNINVENPNLWKGLNLLGFALMEAREQLFRTSDRKSVGSF